MRSPDFMRYILVLQGADETTETKEGKIPFPTSFSVQGLDPRQQANGIYRRVTCPRGSKQPLYQLEDSDRWCYYFEAIARRWFRVLVLNFACTTACLTGDNGMADSAFERRQGR